MEEVFTFGDGAVEIARHQISDGQCDVERLAVDRRHVEQSIGTA